MASALTRVAIVDLSVAQSRWSFFLITSAALCVASVILFAVGAVAISRAHAGTGFAILEPLMDARDVHSAGFYQAKLARATLTLLGVSITTLAMLCISTSNWFFRRFVGSSSAEALAFIRILVCSILFVDAVTIDLGQAAIFPQDVRLPMGVITLLGPLGIEHLNASPFGLRIWQTLAATLLLLSTLGWRTRFVLPLALMFYLVQGGIIRQYDRLFHTGLTPLYVLAALCFTPSGDAWSLDRRRRLRAGEVLPPADAKGAIYGWSRYLCWVPVVVTYVEAGLTKLVHVGPEWAAASNLRAIVLRDSVERAELRRVFIPQIVSAPDIVFSFIGVTTLLAEVFFFLVLFSVAARLLLPAMMMLMHLGIWIFQGIKFFDLVFLQLIFLDPDPILTRLRSRHATPLDDFGTTSPMSARGVSRAYPVGGCAIIVGMLGVWSSQIEYYPLSSMNLYASFNGTSVITHMKVVAHCDEGEPRRVYLQDLVDLLDRTNYRQSIARGFLPEHDPHSQMARRYIQACVASYNAGLFANPIRRVEVQEWTWDYRKQPEGAFGKVARQYVVTIDDPSKR